MNLSRRDLLKCGAGTVAVCVTGLRSQMSAADEPKKKIPIGLQLYSVRDVAPKDVPGTLEAVANLGYQGVEFAGYYDMKAEALKALLDRNGLKCCGAHIGMDALMGDALKATVDFHKALGNKFLIVSWLPPTVTTSIASLIEAGKRFTDLAAQLKDDGLRTGYHAHAHDFHPVAERIPWDVLFSNAGPDVIMQLDTGNCMAGGGDPVATLRKFPHRSASIHLKEHGGPEGAVIGEGDVPWQQVFELCETTGDTEWYVVEQESYRGSSLESVKLCLENLRKMGK